MTLWDRGAQPERTALAWSRTTLALIVAGLLCVRLAPDATAAGLAGAAVCAAASLQFRRAWRQHHRRARRLAAGRAVADPVSVLMATGTTVLLGALGVVFALA
ncbi:DUF202 domain-containing protein [Actinomadura parmotrematis]|uniref:DUF202 domain-containing protein n=1 Tax=Actinomadura parmotrematis TaxID=2864039 RepID=A0ABS7G059_9ACTN|nr:DUF202 domain-containing protein [Actinomadura parmotrematis]MBW8486097.1 DUF202 domain-containing protein [Actinomadura parmotrematis]